MDGLLYMTYDETANGNVAQAVGRCSQELASVLRTRTKNQMSWEVFGRALYTLNTMIMRSEAHGGSVGSLGRRVDAVKTGDMESRIRRRERHPLEKARKGSKPEGPRPGFYLEAGDASPVRRQRRRMRRTTLKPDNSDLIVIRTGHGRIGEAVGTEISEVAGNTGLLLLTGGWPGGINAAALEFFKDTSLNLGNDVVELCCGMRDARLIDTNDPQGAPEAKFLGQQSIGSRDPRLQRIIVRVSALRRHIRSACRYRCSHPAKVIPTRREFVDINENASGNRVCQRLTLPQPGIGLHLPGAEITMRVA